MKFPKVALSSLRQSYADFLSDYKTNNNQGIPWDDPLAVSPLAFEAILAWLNYYALCEQTAEHMVLQKDDLNEQTDNDNDDDDD